MVSFMKDEESTLLVPIGKPYLIIRVFDKNVLNVIGL